MLNLVLLAKGLFMAKNETLHPVDQAYLQIASGLIEYVVSCAETAALTIIETSGTYLSKSAQQALQNFHTLYSEQSGITETMENYNRDVDNLFDDIQKQLQEGKDIESHDIHAEHEVERVTISGLQKQLETLIRIEAGIKDKLLPVLSSMQFEDMIKSRLGNLKTFWQTVLEQPVNTKDQTWNKLLEDLGSQTKSTSEREQFFQLVLHTSVPEHLRNIQSIDWLDLAS